MKSAYREKKNRAKTLGRSLKIGIDAYMLFNHPCGITNYLHNLLNEFAKMDSRHEFILFTDSKNQHELKYNFSPNIRFNKSSIPTPFSRLGSSLNPFWYGLYLPLQLKNNNLDVFFAPNFVTPSFFKGKCVVTIHDIGPIVNNKPYPKKYILYFAKIVKRATQRAHKVITVSLSSKSDLINCLGVDENKIEVVYHGKDERFKEIKEQELIKKVLHYYKIPNDFILFVGDLGERKNLGTLILAYGKLKNEYKIPQELVLVGKPGFRYSQIVNLIRTLDLERYVYIASNVSDEDLPVVYSAARIFVLPSLFEGFGFPALEAMACGTPVVTSNKTSIPEVVGDAGILVDAKNTNQLASAILKILKNDSLREELRTKGLKRAQQFSWRKAAEETLDILERATFGRL